MSRYTGPAYKKSRRLGFSTLENGKDLARRPYAPGIHGTSRRKKVSEYGIQLQEKQKVRFMYGLNEKQFRRTFEKASKMKGIAGENFLKLLESRLDNLVYRMGLATSRRGARQIVNHGHIEVNGKKVKVPAFVEFDKKKLTGTYLRLPERNELNAEINESLIVEFYNR